MCSSRCASCARSSASFCGLLGPLSFEHLPPPLRIFQSFAELFGQLGIGRVAAELGGGDRRGPSAGLVREEHEQHDQRPHRADQHGEERETARRSDCWRRTLCFMPRGLSRAEL